MIKTKYMVHHRETYAYFLIVYFVILLLLASQNLQMFDTYYYWDWSRHLDLSYYDGPPLIAYFIKLFTLVFGDTQFALNAVGIVVMAISCRIIYKTARFFLSIDASYVATMLWLFSPIVTMDILKQTTYDTPLTLFWALTLYYICKYINAPKNSDLYRIGASVGLLMLSKYSGIVLILAFIIFILITPYRSLFKNRHFYFASILALFIFSPVLYWNYQHNWQSFIYQLTVHRSQHRGHSIGQVIQTFFSIFLPWLNVMMLPPVLYWFKRRHIQSSAAMMYFVVCATMFCFYLFIASSTNIRGYWLSQYIITSALLGGFCFETFKYRRLFYTLIAVYSCISFVILLNGYFHFTASSSLYEYQAIQKLNKKYPKLPKVVVTTGWFEARMLFHLKNKPMIYTLNCQISENQYGLWSVEIAEKIKNKHIKQVLYIDKVDRSDCIKTYFDTCQSISIDDSNKSHQRPAVFAFICSQV